MIYKYSDYLAILSHKKKQFKWGLRVVAAMKAEDTKKLKSMRKIRKRKPKNLHRNRGFAVEEMDKLSDAIFEKMFRVDRSTFNELSELVDPIVKRNELKSIQSSGSCIPTDTRLAVTLRWLAGGSYLDLCFAWGISIACFFSDRGVLWPTIEALDEVLKLGFPLNDISALEEISNGFNRHSNGIMNGCVLAIDGLAVRTRQPYVTENKNTKSWRCRKGGFALIVMAGSDVNGKFLMATADHCGSTHDITCWENSALYAAIRDGKLDSRFFVIGDEAFTNLQQVLSPYSGRGLGRWKDAFNYWLSHSRQSIERAFGMLVMRWGILVVNFCLR